MDIFGVFPIFMIFFVALAIAGVVAASARTSRTNSVLLDAARRLGLSTTGARRSGFAKIEGHIGSAAVEVAIKSSGQNNNQRQAVYSLSYPDLGTKFRFTAANRITRLLPTLVTGDVEIGDEMFDDAVIVRTPDSAAVAGFLDRTRREAVLVALRNHPGLEIDEHSMTWSARGIPSTSEEVVAAVQRLAGLAATLGVGVPRDATRSPAAPPPLRTHPGDPFAAARSAPSIRPAPVSQPAPQPPSAPTGDSLVATVADFFRGTMPSHDVQARFRETVVGRTVHGSGEVRRVHSFRFDLDFGDGPGIRATVEMRLPDAASALRAELKLPEGTELERGQTVRFAGTLVKITPIIRTVYLDEARLL